MNDTVKKILIIGIAVAVVLSLLSRVNWGSFSWPFGGGQETTGSGPVIISPDQLRKYLPESEFQGLTFTPGLPIPQGLIDQFLAGKIQGVNRGSKVVIAAAPTTTSGGMATFTPLPTRAPTRTPTPIVMRPMTGTETIAFPPTASLVMKGNENSLPVHVNVGGKNIPSSYWAKFDGSCGELWCRGPLQMVVPITGTFTLPPTLAVVNGEVSYQAANVVSNYDLASLSFDVSLDAPTSKDMKFGDETGVTEIWSVGKTGNNLGLLKVRIQRWDAMNLQLTPLEMVVSFAAGELPGYIGPVPPPTSTPTATVTPTRGGPTATRTRVSPTPTRTATPTH